MIDKLKSGDTVIVPTKIKVNILKEMADRKILKNIKFYSLDEFKKNYFGTYKKEAVYFLVKNYHLKGDVALEYLDNMFYNYDALNDMFTVLKDNDFLDFNPYFKEQLKRIVVIGYSNIDKYLMQELAKYDVIYINNEVKNILPKVYEFAKQSDEVLFVASKIRELIKSVDINDIYLVCPDEYKQEIRRVFRLFDIPINLDKSKKIYGTETVRLFLEELIVGKDIVTVLEKVPNNNIKNKIIDICNEYSFNNIVDEAFIEVVSMELKRATISNDYLKKGVEIKQLGDIQIDNKYYFWLGFNQGIVPRIYRDDLLIKDEERKKLGLNTSLENFLAEKETISNIIKSVDNLFISYALKNNYNTFYPSPLVSELNLEVVKNAKLPLIYSNKYNLLKLGSSLDKLIKYNEKDENLELLLNTYPNNSYNTYQNKYKQVDFADLKDYLKEKINLSYSSMNNYYLCAFRFYIENVLKLDPYEESFAAFLGSLFHDCLSHMYDEAFNLESNYNSYLSKKELTNKERFFVDKLYKTLEFIIDTIKYQESFSKFDKVLTEQHISIDKSGELNINFLGFVDKIKYLEEDGKTLVAIIDYKTGSVETTLDNINYGLHLQLPVYIYLTKKGLHKDVRVGGFYLQKILSNPKIDSENVDEDVRKSLRLEGFTLDDEEVIRKFDSSYEKSEVIKGMALTKNGFARYTKLVSDKDVDTIVELVDNKINETVEAIEKTNFAINPKRIDGKLVGCEFCKFKEICYRREEDIVNLKYTKYEDLGDEGNA